MTQLGRSPQQIGHAIRLARRERGWNQTVLADHAGVRQETISLIENGNPATRLDTILRIIAVLGLDLIITQREAPTNSEFAESVAQAFIAKAESDRRKR